MAWGVYGNGIKIHFREANLVVQNGTKGGVYYDVPTQ